MGILSMRLDDEMDGRLAREAERERKSRSEVVREALAAFLDSRERQRFLSDIARAAREVTPAEARAIAEEALPLDNEALHAAEPRAAYASVRKAKGRRR
ncbi:MAG: ribbon-helix-helix protein, CopG family [Betaproteobacteria bacterium]|nr:ribbon-helix-helix protein, CopG family [Betaproteobacteria bacterium]